MLIKIFKNGKNNDDDDHQNVRLVLIIARVRLIFDDASSLVLGQVRLQSHRFSIIVQAVASVQRLHKVREFITDNVDRWTIIKQYSWKVRAYLHRRKLKKNTFLIENWNNTSAIDNWKLASTDVIGRLSMISTLTENFSNNDFSLGKVAFVKILNKKYILS